PLPGASEGDESNIGPGPVTSADNVGKATAVGISGRFAGGAPPARPRPGNPPPPGPPPGPAPGPPPGPPPIWPDSVETHSVTAAVTRANLLMRMRLLEKMTSTSYSVEAACRSWPVPFV